MTNTQLLAKMEREAKNLVEAIDILATEAVSRQKEKDDKEARDFIKDHFIFCSLPKG
ncbi:hypothetical protein FACS1894200_08180 [Spirochaetia bacterium]|nr:hypothetical protein FACS1894200_08180 [Spirochaetia bacterium]